MISTKFNKLLKIQLIAVAVKNRFWSFCAHAKIAMALVLSRLR